MPDLNAPESQGPSNHILSSNILYCVALLMEAVVFHRHVLFYRGFLFPWDFRGVHVPLATFVADSFRRGELPLWDPYTYCGVPIFANIQTALFYPPVLAATLAGAWLGDGLIPRLLAIAVVAQVVFGGICTFALVRRLGARPAAAWIAATVYELGCFFASQAEHMGAMHGASWLPLIWLCVVELRSGLKCVWLAVLSFALSMTIFAGLPQVAVAAFGSALALSVIMAAFRLCHWKLPVHVLFAWAWALLLAAIQFIPTTELTLRSVAQYRAEWLKSGGGIHPGALLSLIIPNYWSVFDLSKFHGPTDLTFLYLYSSILGLALAVAAVLWKPGSWIRVFSVLTAAATIAMLGDQTPVGRTVLMAVPVNIRIGIHPEFIYCAFSLGLAVLAGLGANRFLRSARVQVVAGILIACDLLLVSSGRPMNTSSVMVEPGITHDSVDGNSEVVTRLRTLTGATVPPSRFDMRPDISFAWSSTAALIGIPTANGCDPLAPERVIQVRLSFASGWRWGTCFQVENPSSPVLSLVNDRWLLSRATIANPDLKLAAEAGGYKIYERVHTLPRFFLLNRAKRVNGLLEAANMLHRPDFNPSAFAILEAPGEQFEPLPPSSAGRIDVISYAPSVVTLDAHSSTPSFLVAADAYYPGWEAKIDGQPARLYITDVAFRGIRVPAGDHRIEMRFIPSILYRSAAVSGAALLLVLIVILMTLRSGAGTSQRLKSQP